MSSQEELKILLVKEGLTVEKLADKLSKHTGKHYTRGSLQQKISLSSLRYDEMEEIAEILGYKITIERK